MDKLKCGILIFLIFLSTISFSQTEGYKNIKLGEQFDVSHLSTSYKITQIADKGFRLKSIVPQKFCDSEISYIDIKLNEDVTIKEIQLYTNEAIYYDANQFLNAYKTMADCIVNTVGQAVYYDAGIDRKDGLMTTAWTFDNQKKLLGLYGNSISISEHNISRHFLIAWAQGNGETKMW